MALNGSWMQGSQETEIIVNEKAATITIGHPLNSCCKWDHGVGEISDKGHVITVTALGPHDFSTVQRVIGFAAFPRISHCCFGQLRRSATSCYSCLLMWCMSYAAQGFVTIVPDPEGGGSSVYQIQWTCVGGHKQWANWRKPVTPSLPFPVKTDDVAACPAAFPLKPNDNAALGSAQIAHKTVQSVGECCSFCQSNPKCIAFTFKSSTTRSINCWAHADITCEGEPHGPRISGVMCRPPTANCSAVSCPPSPSPGPPSPHPHPSPSPPPPPTTVSVNISIGPTVIHKVLPEYASINLDYWHNTTGTINKGISHCTSDS